MKIGPNFDNAIAANRLNLTREQMIAKYGEPGTTPIEQIASENNFSVWDLVGSDSENDLNENTENQFAENSLSSILEPLKNIVEFLMGLIEKMNVGTNEDETEAADEDTITDAAYTEATFVNFENSTGEIIEDAKEINSYKSTSSKKKTTSKKTSDSSNKDNVDDKTKKQDDKIKEIADEAGYDKKTVSAIAKAAATGEYGGAPEEVVPKMAYDLGLPESAVADILKYLNNGSI